MCFVPTSRIAFCLWGTCRHPPCRFPEAPAHSLCTASTAAGGRGAVSHIPVVPAAPIVASCFPPLQSELLLHFGLPGPAGLGGRGWRAPLQERGDPLPAQGAPSVFVSLGTKWSDGGCVCLSAGESHRLACCTRRPTGLARITQKVIW